MTYSLVVAKSAARALAQTLPEPVATAARAFTTGALLENPHRLGKELRAPLEGRWSARRGQYRVIYTIDETDKGVVVLQIAHRSDGYR